MNSKKENNVLTEAVLSAFNRGVGPDEISNALGAPPFAPEKWSQGTVSVIPQFQIGIANIINGLKPKP